MLLPDERFRAFTVPGTGDRDRSVTVQPPAAGDDPGSSDVNNLDLTAGDPPDLLLEVEAGTEVIPAGAVKVFDAQLMEETPRGARNTGEPFWEVLDDGTETYVRAYLKNPERTPVMVMPHGSTRWKLFAGTGGLTVDPLPYPVDGLLLYFLASAGGDIMIHGSGVICGGRGWLFTGRSGSGKTTLARIFDGAGDRVIHDDRLVLRREGERWVMHNTPVYRNDEPRSAPLDHLWVIRHGPANVSEPVGGAEAVAVILSNCIQQNWDREAASRLAASVEELVSTVRVSRLSFLPDSSLRDYLVARESAGAVTAAAAASAILAEGRSVTIIAGGYSMWPAIKPGERILITPYDPQIPLAKGMVVALRRDGGFVTHRVTDYRRGQFMNFIRTRGDTGIIYDTWIPAGDVAGLVKKVTEEGKTMMVSPQRMPYYLGSLAVALINLWNVVRRRFRSPE